MAKHNKEQMLLRQIRWEMSKDVDEMFAMYKKYLPTNVKDHETILIHSIYNVGCICKIIESNPNAKYTLYGNKFFIEGLRELYSELNIIAIDCPVDPSKYDFVVYRKHPDTSKRTNFHKLGIMNGSILIGNEFPDITVKVIGPHHVEMNGKRYTPSYIAYHELVNRGLISGKYSVDGYHHFRYNGRLVCEIRQEQEEHLCVVKNKT